MRGQPDHVVFAEHVQATYRMGRRDGAIDGFALAMVLMLLFAAVRAWL